MRKPAIPLLIFSAPRYNGSQIQNGEGGSKQMRKLTLLAIAAVLMLAQSSPAFSSTFNGPYACRASGVPTYSLSAPVMTISANAGGTFSAGTLLFWQTGGLCQYELTPSLTSCIAIPPTPGSAGTLFWASPFSEPSGCPSGAVGTNVITINFGFVLSGLPSSGASANTVQLTDQYGLSWECTQK